MAYEKEIRWFKEMWGTLFPRKPLPSDSEIALWLLQHGFKTVHLALVELGEKFHREGGNMTPIWMVRFFCTVANRITQGQPGKYVTYK